MLVLGGWPPPEDRIGGTVAALFTGVDLPTGRIAISYCREQGGRPEAAVAGSDVLTSAVNAAFGTQMTETVHAHADVSRRRAREMAVATLKPVGFGDAEARLSSYPHEYSGGMRQRVAIAIALLHQPDLIIADEPTTALDVTVQAQILSEVQRLARVSGAAWIWITHDLSVVA